MIKSSAKTKWFTPGWIMLIVCCAVVLGYGSTKFSPLILVAGIVGVLLVGIIYANPVVGMYLLTFFLPFERIGSVDVGGITIRISQVIAILTLTAWMSRGLILQKFKFRPFPLIIPIGIFIAVNILALVNAPNLHRSLLVLGFTIFTILVAMMLPNIIRHTFQIEWLTKILFISVTLVSLFGLFQFLGDMVGLPTSLTGLRPQYTKAILGFPRVQATALEPLYFANYLLIPMCIALAVWLSKSSKIKSWQLLSIVLLAGINLVLTVSRGGYIAAAIAFMTVCLIYFRQLFTVRSVVTGMIVISLVVGVSWRFLNGMDQITSFIEHVTDLFGGASYSERVETFTIADHIWLEHPWIGIGPGSFGPYASYHPLIVPAEGYKIVNNEYIELLAETGLIGLSCYLLLVMMVLLRSIKAWRVGKNNFLKSILIGTSAAYIGTLVQYNSFSILYIMQIWFTIGLLVAIQNILIFGDEKPTHLKSIK